MNHRLYAARAAVAAVLCSAASAAFAQTYTLISPPLPSGNLFVCTLTNVSNQAASVQKLEIVEGGTVLWDGSNSCTGTLVAGKQCRVQAVLGSTRRPYCRAQYTGVDGSVVGSIYGNYTVNGVSQPNGAATALAMQAVKTIPLATAN